MHTHVHIQLHTQCTPPHEHAHRSYTYIEQASSFSRCLLYSTQNKQCIMVTAPFHMRQTWALYSRLLLLYIVFSLVSLPSRKHRGAVEVEWEDGTKAYEPWVEPGRMPSSVTLPPILFWMFCRDEVPIIFSILSVNTESRDSKNLFGLLFLKENIF